MKRNYQICPQEQDNWCVPATLQTVLKTRGIQISQLEIARNFRRVIRPKGTFKRKKFNEIDFNIGLLNQFLNRFNLESEFYNPYRVSYYEKFNWRELELKEVLDELEKDEKDLLAGYNHSYEWDHLALVHGFDSSGGIVSLVDNKNPPYMKIRLSELFEGMYLGEDSPFGFYVVGKR